MGLEGWHQRCYIKLLLLFWFCGAVPSKMTYIPELSMLGYTVPRGNIVIEYGDPLDITCVVVNTVYSNASANLSFKRNSEMIPFEMIDVVNSTAIKLHIEEPAVASDDIYRCLLKNYTVCMNRVTVGIKPQDVTDFKCIAYNNDNLTCTWTAPQNYVRTDYNLIFGLGEGRSARFKYPCPSVVADVNKMSCSWNAGTVPSYRPVQEMYNFTLFMKNKFGNNQLNEIFNHFAHVLSSPPENLTSINTTSSSVYLYWQVPLSMQTFPPGVHHRVLYQCEYGEKKWNDGGMLTHPAHRRFAYFNLTNLKYAHALCDIRVSLRSAKALSDDESMWSRNASITVRTSSKIPDEPPETNVGSFEIVAFGNRSQFREAYIYWKQIPEIQRNGPEFEYSISVEEDDSVRPIEVTNSYAKFKDLSISKSYTFHIWLRNANGLSSHQSTVFVPKQTDRVKKPISFTKVEFSESEFELTWEAPELGPKEYITNYTIFFCSNERDRPDRDQCNGMLNWTVIPNDTTNFSMTVDKHKIFQFAIAANTHSSSSGMTWVGYTVILNKNMGKLKKVWIYTFGATFIAVAALAFLFGWAKSDKADS